MLTLNDGRSELWQWDTGRTLSVPADCSQVHFSNKVFGRSIDVDVVDGVAIIPDILLQTDKELTAWAFVGTAEDGYTKISKVFKVNRRNKPADYVFTPPEQTTLSEILERLNDIEYAQSDWLAAEGEIGHVLNRTHYEETKWEELLPPTVVTEFTDKGNAYLPVFEIVGGEKYRVYYNGAKYEVIAQNIYNEEMSVAGARLGDWSAWEYPFVIIYFAGDGNEDASTMLRVADGVTEVVLSVARGSDEMKKLDEKFLPDSVECVTLRSGTAGSSKLFKITVDDTGIITATEVDE